MNKPILLAVVAIMTSQTIYSSDTLKYPEAPKDSTEDDYFGIKVADPYRPLENDTSVRTARWVEAERRLTESYLEKIPFRQGIRHRLRHRHDVRKNCLPSTARDGRYYFFSNDGLQNQSVLYRTEDLRGEPETVLDPNTLSSDGTVALTGVYFSNDGKLMAYSISRGGSDWTELFVMETETLKTLEDHLLWAKFTGAEWHGDGFYYSAYPAPDKGGEYSSANTGHSVYYHRIGTPQETDSLVYGDAEHPLHFHSAQVTENASALIIHTSGRGIGNAMTIKDLTVQEAAWKVMTPSQDYLNDIIGILDGTIYIRTSFGASRNRVMTVGIDAPQMENWKELVPEREGVLSDARLAGDKLVLKYEKDASDQVVVCDLRGNETGVVALPTFGTIEISSSQRHAELFYSFSSFLYPSQIYRYDTEKGESSLCKPTSIEGFEPEEYVTERQFYVSDDGTEIPLFLTYRRRLRRDGNNPESLNGSGGSNISLTPGFSAQRLLWLENGGIYAQASLRGGSEYGEEWHRAGTKTNKMNVFNDFISAARYLIDEGWTSPEKIAIEGGSNGGLLVGAVVNMRPDLFAVAIPRVGVMDMMRYQHFTIGWNWASDYGTSDDSSEMARYLLGYSPVHNIRDDGTPYPAIMATTADHDDRVVPAHSFKYAAALQAADTGDAPKLIRIDSDAGHGGGKPVAKTIDEYADIYSFIFQNLGIVPDCK